MGRMGSLVVGLCVLACAGAGVARGHVGEQAAGRVALVRSAASFARSHRAAARRDDRLRLVVVARPGSADRLAERLRGAGAQIETRSGRIFDVVARRHTLATITAAAAAVRPAGRPVTDAILGQGVQFTNANSWQAVGLNGAGSRVAVVDLGFGGLAAAQAAGEVPTSAVTIDYCHGQFSGDKHGTAVAEIVSEEAPGAQLYLICVDDVASLAQAEQYAIANGVTVISHSVGWFNTWSGDGFGPAGTPDAIVADAAAHNILWVNAAGNDAIAHWSGTWSDTNGNDALNFTPSDELSEFAIPPNEEACAELRWNEWPSAQHDYDLYLVDSNTQAVLGSGEDDQSTTHGPPVEEACYENGPAVEVAAAVITVVGAPGSPRLDLFVPGIGAQLQYQTPAGSLDDPAAQPDGVAVGAVCWQNKIGEFFSSRGPTLDGRLKPDLVGPDRVSSFTYGAFDSCDGSGGFAGTSAAAPYIAGAAALVHQRYPSLTATQLKTWLMARSLDLGDPGVDNTFGAGNLMLPFIEIPGIEYANPPVTDVKWHEATFDAIVTPKDSDTTVTFEYGTTGSYGSVANVSTTIPANAAPTTVSVHVTGLTPNTNYHFRVVASNLGGKNTGGDQTFTTQIDLPPSVRAHRTVGRLGRLVQLPYTLGDDTGEARADVVVYRGTAKVATIAQDFMQVTDATPTSVTWRAPKKLAKKTVYRFCVTATDRDGNASDQSCAGIRLH